MHVIEKERLTHVHSRVSGQTPFKQFSVEIPGGNCECSLELFLFHGNVA